MTQEGKFITSSLIKRYFYLFISSFKEIKTNQVIAEPQPAPSRSSKNYVSGCLTITCHSLITVMWPEDVAQVFPWCDAPFCLLKVYRYQLTSFAESVLLSPWCAGDAWCLAPRMGGDERYAGRRHNTWVESKSVIDSFRERPLLSPSCSFLHFWWKIIPYVCDMCWLSCESAC